MITGSDIQLLVELLSRREACIYHACQLSDFRSYLEIGGVPSRSYMADYQKQFTSFDTDAADKKNEVWDKVFVNLQDLGEMFARGSRAVPVPYGPILLQLHPAALAGSTDVAICLRSAGAKNFDRSLEALRSVREIDRLFENSENAPFPLANRIRYKNDLRANYSPNATSPEVSCSIASGYIPIQYLVAVWVDEYCLRGHSLLDLVRTELTRASLRAHLHERQYSQLDRKALLSEFAIHIAGGRTSIGEITSSGRASAALCDYFTSLHDAGTEYQFPRYANYLLEGTLGPAGMSIAHHRAGMGRAAAK